VVIAFPPLPSYEFRIRVADLALREGQPAGLGLRIHLVVGAVMAVLDIHAKILFRKKQTPPCRYCAARTDIRVEVGL
jgi:hypothetical protein